MVGVVVVVAAAAVIVVFIVVVVVVVVVAIRSSSCRCGSCSVIVAVVEGVIVDVHANMVKKVFVF